MLLQKGMLKIDAMSIADTLDGYPDLFVSALTGESLTAPNPNIIQSSTSSATNQHWPYSTSSVSMDDNRHDLNPNHHNHLHMYDDRIYNVPGTDVVVSDHDEGIMYTSSSLVPKDGDDTQSPSRQHQPSQGGAIPSNIPTETSSLTNNHPYKSWKGYSSYDQNYNHPYISICDENQMDPDTSLVKYANQESRRESIFMLLGFSLFSIIPSLIYTILPSLLWTATTATTTAATQFLQLTTTLASSQNDNHDPDRNTLDFNSSPTSSSSPTLSATSTKMTIHPDYITIILTACIMWSLGIWKSRFLDAPNWFRFGIETVSVLFLCILCAYGLGALFNHLFLPNEYQIIVMTPSSSSSSSLSTTNHHIMISTSSSSSSSGMKHAP
jgi:hypothetical protein